MKYYKKYAFSLVFNGMEIGNFKTCSGLQSTIGVSEEAEGGALTNTKELGRVSFDNITLTRGLTINRACYDLFKSYEQGITDKPISLTIIQKTRGGDVVGSYAIPQALPIRYKVGDWDAMSDEALTEELEITHQGFIKN